MNRKGVSTMNRIETGELEVFEGGGVASKEEYRFDLCDAGSLLEMARVMYEGDKAGRTPDQWRKLPIEAVLNHAAIHLFKFLAGDRRMEHLSHLLCRAMMAVAIYRSENEIRDEDV